MLELKDNYVIIGRELLEMWNIDILRIPIYIILSSGRGLNDTVGLCVNQIAVKCGYTPNRNKGKVNDRIKKVLYEFEKLKILKIDDTYNQFVGDKFLYLYLDPYSFDVKKSFCRIYFQELDKIFNYKSLIDKTNISTFNILPDKLLYLLTYIRINKLRRTELQQNNPKIKPEVFYKQINVIAKTLNLSERTVVNCIKILEQLDIIVTKPLQRYKDKNENWHTDVTIFVDKYDGWEQEIKWCEDQLYNNKKIKYSQTF